MSYCIQQHYAEFFIPADKQVAALKAVKSKLTGDKYSWVSGAFKDAPDLVSAFDDWRIFLEKDEATGDIVAFSFEGEKLGDEFKLLKQLLLM